MKKTKTLLLILLSGIALSCVDENLKEPQDLSLSKETVSGFWRYKQVLVNDIDIEILTPGFSVSNYLHLKEDDTYGKCYILGDWNIEGEYLKLNQHDFSDRPARYYKVVSVTENTLTLEIRLRKSQYEIGISQFKENEIITVTEVFER